MHGDTLLCRLFPPVALLVKYSLDVVLQPAKFDKTAPEILPPVTSNLTIGFGFLSSVIVVKTWSWAADSPTARRYASKDNKQRLEEHYCDTRHFRRC